MVQASEVQQGQVAGEIAAYMAVAFVPTTVTSSAAGAATGAPASRPESSSSPANSGATPPVAVHMQPPGVHRENPEGTKALSGSVKQSVLFEHHLVEHQGNVDLDVMHALRSTSKGRLVTKAKDRHARGTADDNGADQLCAEAQHQQDIVSMLKDKDHKVAKDMMRALSTMHKTENLSIAAEIERAVDLVMRVHSEKLEAMERADRADEMVFKLRAMLDALQQEGSRLASELHLSRGAVAQQSARADAADARSMELEEKIERMLRQAGKVLLEDRWMRSVPQGTEPPVLSRSSMRTLIATLYHDKLAADRADDLEPRGPDPGGICV